MDPDAVSDMNNQQLISDYLAGNEAALIDKINQQTREIEEQVRFQFNFFSQFLTI